MTKHPDAAPVDVVIVSYRSAGYIRTCLESVARALQPVPGARIVLVDNDSRDDLAAAVEGLTARLVLRLRDVNDGFAAGCHAGAELSTARRLLFVNPDATVEPDAVMALLREAEEHPRAGVVGGRAVTDDGSADAQSWMGRPTLWSAVCFASGLSSLLPGSRIFDPESSEGWDGRPRDVPVVSGGLMLVERECWDQVGGFSPDFFLYGEDVDFCLRVAAAGWSPRVTGGAVYRHAVGSSSSGSNRLPLVMRGRVSTYRRNLPRPWGRVAGELLVAGTGLRAGLARFRPPGGRRAHPHHRWRETWTRRTEWRRGW